MAAVQCSYPAHLHQTRKPQQQAQTLSQPHAHDIVFQQMILRTAQARPGQHLPLPLTTIQISVNVGIGGKKPQQINHRPILVRPDETDDEGYHGDRDNAMVATANQSGASSSTRKPLVRVTSDVILEQSPQIATSSSSSVARCQHCRTSFLPLSYRLRLIDPPPATLIPSSLYTSIYHLECFEDIFNLEQPDAFSRIYPAPSTTPSNASPSWLNEDARALVNNWKLQRRREGLESAAGPDSGIAVRGSVRQPITMTTPRKTGDKRSLVESELEDDRKRSKYYTSDDGYGRVSEILARKGISVGNRRPVPTKSQSEQQSTRRSGVPLHQKLPAKLSDALKILPRAYM